MVPEDFATSAASVCCSGSDCSSVRETSAASACPPSGEINTAHVQLYVTKSPQRWNYVAPVCWGTHVQSVAVILWLTPPALLLRLLGLIEILSSL